MHFHLTPHFKMLLPGFVQDVCGNVSGVWPMAQYTMYCVILQYHNKQYKME